jgi:hypothetical protein
MSAYICNPEHFGILAAYAVQHSCAIYDWREKGTKSIETAQNVARGLARENIRSVAHRYPDTVSGDRPGPSLLDEEIEEAAALYAAHFVTNPQQLRPIQIIKLCQGYDHQSCETDDWKDTLAWRQMDWIKGEAISHLDGYNAADWSFEKTIPEIEALYAKHEED